MQFCRGGKPRKSEYYIRRYKQRACNEHQNREYIIFSYDYQVYGREQYQIQCKKINSKKYVLKSICLYLFRKSEYEINYGHYYYERNKIEFERCEREEIEHIAYMSEEKECYADILHEVFAFGYYDYIVKAQEDIAQKSEYERYYYSQRILYIVRTRDIKSQNAQTYKTQRTASFEEQFVFEIFFVATVAFKNAHYKANRHQNT